MQRKPEFVVAQLQILLSQRLLRFALAAECRFAEEPCQDFAAECRNAAEGQPNLAATQRFAVQVRFEPFVFCVWSVKLHMTSLATKKDRKEMTNKYFCAHETCIVCLCV